MTLDPCEPLGFKDTITLQITNSLGENKTQTEIASNISSLQNLYYWAAFLGFGENIGGTASNQGVRLFMPNPCSVIERNLSKIFQKTKVNIISHLVTNFSSILIVFDEKLALKKEAQKRSRQAILFNSFVCSLCCVGSIFCRTLLLHDTAGVAFR